MKRIILTVEILDGEFEHEDAVALADALVCDFTRNTPKGVMFAGKDSTGTRREWYTPEVKISSKVESD